MAKNKRDYRASVQKLDRIGAPGDNQRLDASVQAHGLLPKLSGDATQALLGDGTFGAPAVAAHVSTHENGGSDEIDVGGLSGTLADPQTPTAHASTHADGGSDEITPLSIGARALNGFVNRTGSTLGMSGAKLQLTTGSSYDIWTNGNKYTKSTTQEVDITNDKALNYVYFDSSGTLQMSAGIWDISSDNIPVAIVFKDGANYHIFDERHSWVRNRDWHKWAHVTIGARWGSGLTGTFTNATLSIVQGVVYDEDIDHDTGGTKTSCALYYRDTGATAMRCELGVSTPYKLDTVIKYDNGGTLTSVDVGKYVCSWVYAAPSSAYPIIVVVGQAQYNTLAQARSAALPTIPLSTAEWKLLYRVIYQNAAPAPGTATYIEAQDYRTVSSGPPITATATDHAGLVGRDSANSHPADAISYDNTSSGLVATDVQAAIDEVAGGVGPGGGADPVTDPFLLALR